MGTNYYLGLFYSDKSSVTPSFLQFHKRAISNHILKYLFSPFFNMENCFVWGFFWGGVVFVFLTFEFRTSKFIARHFETKLGDNRTIFVERRFEIIVMSFLSSNAKCLP